VDEHDEHEADRPVTEEPVTERVRIIGAEPAGQLAGEHAAEHPDDRAARYLGFGASEHATESPATPSLYAGEPTESWQTPAPPSAPAPWEAPATDTHDAGRETSAPADAAGEPDDDVPETMSLSESMPAIPELSHWADPPTGQVPAVLDRRGDDEEDRAWGVLGDTGPVWREHEHEWEDGGFDASLLAEDDEEQSMGVLSETPVEERRPWEFDDLSTLARREQPVEEQPAETGATNGGDWWGASAEEATTAVPTPTMPPETTGDDTLVQAPASEERRPTPRRARQPRPARPPAAAGGRSGRNVPVAVATGVAIALVALACFAIGTVATVALATVLVTLAAAETFAALRRAGFRPATLLGLVATVGIMVSAYTKGTAALPLVLVLVLVTTMVWYLVGAERGSPVEGMASTLLGFTWVGLLGSFAALMLAPSVYPHRHGIAFLLGAVVATVGEDVGALAIGAWLGRHQLAPHVSPNKTWEGAIGGAVLAIVASAAITGQVHPFTPAKAAVLGAVVAVVAPIGDLCESLVKRDLGLKDMGSLLPGHGGVLDRVDALLFVLPATYYLVRLLNLG